VPVTRGPLASAVSATGTLNTVITVRVGSQVSGPIKEMSVDFNSAVTKGPIIARINPDLFEAQVNQAKAQLDGAQAMFLNQQAVIDKTRADLESARAALASAHAQTIKSQVAVVDGTRNLGCQQDLRQRHLIAQADEDAAQVQYDSAAASERSSLCSVPDPNRHETVRAAQARSGEPFIGRSSLRGTVRSVLGRAARDLEGRSCALR
jgi:HlyD family secretion protein